MSNLKRVCSFFAGIYIPYFISGSIGSDAPVNNLKLFKTLTEFSSFCGPRTFCCCLKGSQVHTCYFQQQTVPMSLFSDKLSIDEKSQLAAQILTNDKAKPIHWKETKTGDDQVEYKAELIYENSV